MKVNDLVEILSTRKDGYGDYKKLVGKHGCVKSIYKDGNVGVLVDGHSNPHSSTGMYWFMKDEVRAIDTNYESEEIVMENYKYVAIVNLLEDSYKRDYAFALYEEDYNEINGIGWSNDNPSMVVVNARAKDNRMLGTIKYIISAEDYKKENKGAKITAEVVGVVNMKPYIAREEEKVRQKELAKKKAAIEKELEAEINKRKSVEYYEEMAQKYSDNPKIAELVAELRSISV